jgi:hypothetical protein
LAKSDSVDPDTLARLEAITAEITTLDEAHTPPAESSDDEEPHPLRDMLQKFESEHPQLTETLGRIADGLAQLGI